MDGLRMLSRDAVREAIPCCRCGQHHRPWDQIAGKAYCPDCQESIILGLAAPLKEPPEKKGCAACGRSGTVRFLTVPLRAVPVEMDLCPEHLRGLLGRCLGPYAYHQLRRQLLSCGVSANQVFLLHDSFYDDNGRALQPADLPE